MKHVEGLTASFMDQFSVNVDFLAHKYTRGELLNMMTEANLRSLVNPVSPCSVAAALAVSMNRDGAGISAVTE